VTGLRIGCRREAYRQRCQLTAIEVNETALFHRKMRETLDNLVDMTARAGWQTELSPILPDQ